jgi:hypothetical protein
MSIKSQMYIAVRAQKILNAERTPLHGKKKWKFTIPSSIQSFVSELQSLFDVSSR